MLDFLVIVFVVLISVFLIYSICLFLAHCNEKKEVDLDWYIQGYNLKDNFRTLEGCITSDVYTFHKLDVLMDNFRICNVYFEKCGVFYYNFSPTDCTRDAINDKCMKIKSYVKYKGCIYDNGEVIERC